MSVSSIRFDDEGDRERHEPERREEAVKAERRRRRPPGARGQPDAPGDDERVAGEGDERARPRDLPQHHRRATSSQRAVVRTPPSADTIAASPIPAIRSGRSASTLASTSAATGSLLTTVACVAGPGRPVPGSIRWWASWPSPLRHRRRPYPDVATPC